MYIKSSLITIAIVKYKNLDEKIFFKSLYSALSQIGIKYNISIYLDDTECDYKNELINHIKVPKDIQSNPVKIREFIVKNTTTKYLAFWDSDDVFTVDRIYSQYDLIEEKKLEMCFADFQFFNSQFVEKKSFFEIIGFHERKINLYDENYIGFGLIFARTSFLKSLLPFPIIPTLDWWIGITSYLNKLRIGYVDKVLAYYRIHNKSLSRMSQNVEVSDYEKEINNKLLLYKNFSEDEINKRIEFIKKIDLVRDYKGLKIKFLDSKYKNIWGGLIQYEKK